MPWKKSRRTDILFDGGPNPRWISSNRRDSVTRSANTRNSFSKTKKTEKFYIDLPYYGHPYAGEVPSVTVMVVNCEPREDQGELEDIDDVRGQRNSEKNMKTALIGRASFDLRPYLSQNKNRMHGVTLSLQDSKGGYAGKIVCTLQFVLTGVVRLTVLNGSRLRSNLQEVTDVEPYIQARVIPGKGRWKKTSHKKGENPDWGGYTRKATLASFYSLPGIGGYFSSRKGSFESMAPGGTNNTRASSNVLEFKFKDEDRSVIPRVSLQVFDKMDTDTKRDRERKTEKKRMKALEKQVKSLRKRKTRKGGGDHPQVDVTDEFAQSLEGNPTNTTTTRGFVNMLFGRKSVSRNGSPHGATTRRTKKNNGGAKFEEMNINQATTERPKHGEQQNDPDPLSKEEMELMERINNASQKVKHINEGRIRSVEDRLIGTGYVDLRSFLTYDGKREAKTITVDINDENGLAAGQVYCMVEFENASHDPSQEVLTIPDFDITGLSWNDVVKTIGKMTKKDAAKQLRNFYILADMTLDRHVPNFVTQTSVQTKVPKLVVFMMFFSFAFMSLFSLWKGFGNKFMSYIVGVLYPTYQSFKALESKNTDLNTQWLTYWIIYGMFNFLENTILLPLVFVYPTIFYILKMMLLMWLVNPKHLGASIVYYMVIAPLMRSYQNDIDTYIAVFGKTTTNFVKDFAGFYDQLEQEMNYAMTNNLVDQHNFFSNDRNDFGRQSKRLFSGTINELMMDSSSVVTNTRVKLFVALEESPKKAKPISLSGDENMEDIVIMACSKMGIQNFNEYELWMVQDGKLRPVENLQQLEQVQRPRVILRKIEGVPEGFNDPLEDLL